MENDYIEAMYKLFLDEVNKKDWYDLTLDEIRLLKDREKQKEYIKKYQFCVINIINPLCRAVSSKGYGFSGDLTCKQMINKLEKIYFKKKRSKQDMRDIVLERCRKK